MIVKLKTTDWLHGECWPQCLRGHRWGAEMESCCWGDGNRPRINNTSYFCCCCFVFRTHHEAYGILVPWPGIEPMPSAVKMWSPNHWTAREFPITHFILEPKGKKVLIQPGIWVTGILKKDLKNLLIFLFLEKKKYEHLWHLVLKSNFPGVGKPVHIYPEPHQIRHHFHISIFQCPWCLSSRSSLWTQGGLLWTEFLQKS